MHSASNEDEDVEAIEHKLFFSCPVKSNGTEHQLNSYFYVKGCSSFSPTRQIARAHYALFHFGPSPQNDFFRNKPE